MFVCMIMILEVFEPPDRRSGRPVYHIRQVAEIKNSSTLGPLSLSPEVWSFPGLSETNLYALEPRNFPPKLAKSAQGLFPNFENNSH